MNLRDELVKLAQEFDGAEGGTLAYTVTDGRHSMRKNAHDQLMYILSMHPEEGKTMTITAFLEARIASDEAEARAMADVEFFNGGWTDEHANKILAECAAKRAVIEQADEATGLDMSVDNDRLVGTRDMAKEPYCGDLILRSLAAVYSDHPDYQPEWALTDS
jgi:hypothetical protein